MKKLFLAFLVVLLCNNSLLAQKMPIKHMKPKVCFLEPWQEVWITCDNVIVDNKLNVYINLDATFYHQEVKISKEIVKLAKTPDGFKLYLPTNLAYVWDIAELPPVYSKLKLVTEIIEVK